MNDIHTLQPWVSEYIRKPHRNGARGPDAYDCYGLLAVVLREHYGLQVPLHEGVYADRETMTKAEYLAAVEILLGRREEWPEVAQPRPGDGILLRFGKREAHCGVVIALKKRPPTAPPAGTMLHVHEGINVTQEDWDGPRWARRVVSFNRYSGGRGGVPRIQNPGGHPPYPPGGGIV